MSQKLTNNINIGRFFMACFIVFYHCWSYDSSLAINPIDRTVNNIMNSTFNTFGTVGLGYFFSVSGFLMFRNLTMDNYPQKLKRRFFSLFVPYVSWQLILMLYYILRGEYQFTLSSFLTTIFGFVYPFGTVLWYVYVIFWLSVLSPVILVFYRHKITGWIFFVASTIIVSLLGQTDNEQIKSIVSYGYVQMILSYLPPYLLGAFCGRYFVEERPQSTLCIIVCFVLSSFVLDCGIPNFLLDNALKMLPIVILFLLPSLPHLKNKKVYKLTFLIYIVHVPITPFIKTKVVNFLTVIGTPISISSLLERSAVLIVSTILSALIFCTGKKVSPKILSVLTGLRN